MKEQEQKKVLTKRFSVVVYVKTPEEKEYVNQLFVDAETNFHAFAIAWAILKIPQFSRIAWQSTEVEEKK